MSVSYIPEKIKIRLWGVAAGRCQYEGCNESLWRDSLTQAEFNTAYIAHIIADKPDGPRGNPILSERLKDDISNLMLMCDKHHRLIDREDVDGHPVEILRDMKKKHEDRIKVLGSLMEEKRSHVLMYGANVGEHFTPLSWERVVPAMIPKWYPAEKPAIELGLKNSSFQDHKDKYWEIEREHLQRQFHQAVRPRLAMGKIGHFSIFGLAPQPLLIEFGRLLSDIPAAEVYQLHREPPDWKWQESPHDFNYIVNQPPSYTGVPAFNLSLSASIDNSRIIKVLGEDVSIWTMTINHPNNDFLQGTEQLRQFRQSFRRILNEIKLAHDQEALLHLFPAVPVSVAIEIGRVWMPKADMAVRIYDQNKKNGGFSVAFDI